MRTIYMLIALVTFLGLNACNKQGWYEGLKGSARNECTKDREPCPDSPSYEEYKKERGKLKAY